MLRARARLAAVAASVALACALPPVTHAGDVALVPDWTTIAPGFFPLEPAVPAQPVLTAADITGEFAWFVADPFLMHVGDLWYMFFEVTVPQGRIAVATSRDGLEWKYQRIVLAEPFDLSYPHVFQADGIYYMATESASEEAVRLYRTANFPDGWTFVTKLAVGRPFADPTLFRYGGLWWMFVGNGASDTCWLFYSDELETMWTEHPSSPVVASNRALARPAGRAVVLSDNRLFRLAQNATPTYGHAVRAFQVDALTTSTYAEHEIPESPVVQASGQGWNSDGMHQLDPWWTGDGWLVATDGIHNGTWSIGIYRTPPAPTDASAARAAGLRLRCAPNPCHGAGTLRWDAGGTRAPPRLSVYTPSGRRVLTRVLPATATTFVWDRTDARGEAAPAGVYFVRLELGARTETARIVVVR